MNAGGLKMGGLVSPLVFRGFFEKIVVKRFFSKKGTPTQLFLAESHSHLQTLEYHYLLHSSTFHNNSNKMAEEQQEVSAASGLDTDVYLLNHNTLFQNYPSFCFIVDGYI
jgi:hypothetical protein